MALTTGLGQLGQLLGGAAGGLMNQQQYQNDYLNYVTTTGSSSAQITSGIVYPGTGVCNSNPIEVPKPAKLLEKRDEFGWLRARVDEVCWREAA